MARSCDEKRGQKLHEMNSDVMQRSTDAAVEDDRRSDGETC